MPRESPKRRSKRGLRGEDPEAPKQLNAADFAQREGLYRTLVERIPGIVYISEFGPFAKWHYVSPQIQDYLGYTPEEWMADSTLWMKHVHPEDRELVLAEENRLVKTGKAFFAEYRMVARDGRVLWFRDESLVFRKPGPYPPLLYGILYDVTERKAAEEALREFQERLRDTVNNAPLVVFSIDAKGTFLLSEGRGLAALGLAPGQVVGKSIFELYGGNPEILASFRRALAGEEFTIVNTVAQHNLAYEVVWLPHRDGRGEITGVTGVATDITERRHLEEQLRRAQKMEAIGQLAGGVAHDFNNLLMVIRGHVELLLDRPGLDHTIAKNAEAIREAADRAAGITQQLLAFSRKQVLQPRVVELRRVVGDISTLLRRLLGSIVEYRLRLPPEPLWVRADESQLEQVVLNLVINARDAMPNGGVVTAELDRVAGDSPAVRRHPAMPAIEYIRLRVSDTGVGMDAGTQARIFEPFFTTKELGKGTGLGLATVYGIIKQSEGWIWVESEPGSGTTFEIFLPAVEAPETEEQEPAAQPAKRQEPRGSETILVVDDEEGVREVALLSLTAQGYKVLTAESAAQALDVAAAEQGPIHALITDAVMPGMNGPALAERLRAVRPQTRVLYMSGYAQDASVLENAIERGEAFLQKPFSLDMLAQKVRTLLSEES
jgi:PAS domain S-box-containing protein